MSTSASDPVRDIAIVPESLAAKADSGEIFNPAILHLVDHVSALRFLEWMHTNNSTQSRRSDRPLRSHMTWRHETRRTSPRVQFILRQQLR